VAPDEPGFDLDAIEYISAIWFVPYPGGDWMAMLFRLPGDRRWRVKYRFGYYSGSRDPFDDSDRKSWYAGAAEDIHTPEDVELGKIDFLANTVANGKGAHVDRVDIRGDKSRFFAAVADRPWIHLLRVPLADARREPQS